MNLLTLTISDEIESVSLIECGQPGNFPVDVVSKSFPRCGQSCAELVFVHVPVHRATSPTMYGVT